jgi:branched-chain amino acid transport system permease protein
MIVLGGMGNIWGVMIGAMVLVSLSEVLRELLPLIGLPVNVRFLAFGLIMVLMMRYRPAGLMPIPAVAAKMRAGRVKRKKVKADVGMKQ